MSEFNYNVRILPKGSMETLGPNFNAKEIKCNCSRPNCIITLISTKTIKCFNNLRDLAQCPLVITSGYRCPAHNIDIGGSMLSRHQTGEALDILKPVGIDLVAFHKLALKSGFTFIKEYDGPARLHCDTR